MIPDTANLDYSADSIAEEKLPKRPWVTPAIDRLELKSALGLHGNETPFDNMSDT